MPWGPAAEAISSALKPLAGSAGRQLYEPPSPHAGAAHSRVNAHSWGSVRLRATRSRNRTTHELHLSQCPGSLRAAHVVAMAFHHLLQRLKNTPCSRASLRPRCNFESQIKDLEGRGQSCGRSRAGQSQPQCPGRAPTLRRAASPTACSQMSVCKCAPGLRHRCLF